VGVDVCWDPAAEQSPARVAAWRSMNAVTRGAKDEWLTLFAPDGVVEDPVAPSMFDAEGKGHRGRDGISAFWDATIAHVERFECDQGFARRRWVVSRCQCRHITTHLPGDYRVDTEGFVYRVGEDGLIVSMRAFWEAERTMATARHV
jgi:steroid delta-isomerase